MKKMAFIYLSNYEDWPLGGMLNYAKNLIPYIKQDSRWDVDLWGGELTDKKNSDPSIKVYTKIKTSKKILPNFVWSFFGVISNRRHFSKYDIVYSHTSATTIAMKICYPKKFIVHHQHGLSYKDNKGFIRILNIGYTVAQLLADVTLFVASEHEVDKHLEKCMFKNKKFYSVGSPIDFEFISNKNRTNTNDAKELFTYTGRIDECKNISLLVESFYKYHKDFPNSELYIIGDGPDFETTKSKIDSLNASDFIHMTGRKNHDVIVDYLVNSDVFLFPSKAEGVSLSILEALSAGLPVVGFDVTGVRDLVIDGETGVLVESMDTDSFIKGITRAYSEKNMLKVGCKKFASKFAVSEVGKNISNIIDNEYRSLNNEKDYY